MSRILTKIYQLPIIGNLICYTAYICLRLVIPPMALLSGGIRLNCGTSVFWIPRNKKQTILDGIELLRTKDQEMFSRLTSKQRLIIYYGHNKNVTNAGGRVFGMHRRYIEMGSEGIACFIVQSIITSAAAPSINQCKLNDHERASLKIAGRRVLEWMQQHSFHPELIKVYQKVVEKWEQQERFQ